jgi:hypothetical protein
MSLALPSNITNVTALVTKAGKTVGSRVVFGSDAKASDVKAALAKTGLKGNELKLKVNEVLTGRTPLAWAEHDAMTSAIRSAGFVPDYMDARKSSAAVRFVKPAEVKVKQTEAQKRADALALLGLSEEEVAALLNKKG